MDKFYSEIIQTLLTEKEEWFIFLEKVKAVNLKLPSVILKQINKRQSDLTAALQRVQHGQFGRCIDCGEAIEQTRLKQVPHASRCFPCQQEQERTGER